MAAALVLPACAASDSGAPSTSHVMAKSVPLLRATADAAPVSMKDDATGPHIVPTQRIELHRTTGGDAITRVSVGIPFPAGVLSDARLLRILDAHGREVPASIKVTLRWYASDRSIRAVRAQFDAAPGSAPQVFYFSLDHPRQRELSASAYDAGLIAGEQGLRVPAIFATLTPAWLSDSLIAGPQLPAAPYEPQAKYVDAQFAWARKLPYADATAWLFDRPTTLFKAYVRTGRLDYLQAAELSYRFYMKYIRRDGIAVSPSCAGGWTYNDKPCDVKYVYVEPILLALALTGDDSEHDTATVDHMMTLWENGGWNERPAAYSAPSDYFTERLAGLGLLETVNGYELTGDPRYLARVRQRIGWLYDHQRNNPDGLGNDGSWRSSWNLHENDTWDPAHDVRGSSPWMSENIIDGLWHAWLVTKDPRIPEMISGFGRYLEQHGWIDAALLVNPHDWRNPCSGPNGQIAWYWSSAHASPAALMKIQESEGWYSDGHNVEIAFAVAAARYFERDPVYSSLLKKRLSALASSYSSACASGADPLRRFNWNNRGSGVTAWLEKQPAGSGAAAAPVRGATP